MLQNETWYQEQRKKFNDRLQNAIEEEFSRTHDLIMENLTPKETTKDKGTIRNINNYRMKFWCECFLHYNQIQTRENSSFYADICLELFDKRFNQ